MKLVTWNCNRGPASRKLVHLDPLQPTIAVMPECGCPPTQDSRTLWLGESGRLGIAVKWAADCRVSTLPLREVPRYTFPLQVQGPMRFLLLVVWSKTDRDYRYVKAVIRAAECYRDLIAAQPTVIMGDFNSNTIWDYKRPLDESHSGLVRQLSSLGLLSAYHEFHGEPHGRETRPTLYLLKQRERAYHIDYCFIPKAWLPSVRAVSVGSYDDWIGLSDHTPLCVELDSPGEEHARRLRAEAV